jgi:hypothetical protein
MTVHVLGVALPEALYACSLHTEVISGEWQEYQSCPP